MNYNIIAIPKFEKELKKLSKKHPSLKYEYIQLVQSLSERPDQGIPIGNHCYKIRLSIASKGKGKSGSARVVTYIQISKKSVYLLSIYNKSEQEIISGHELYSLLKYIPH